MDITSKSNQTLEFDKIKQELSNFAKFEQSKNLCIRLSAASNFDKIQEQIKLTREAKYILDLAKEAPTEYIADITRIKNNAAVSYLTEQELNDIAKTMKSSRLLKRFIFENSQDDFSIKDLSSRLFADKELEDKIFSTFDENLNIRQNATPELKGLYSSLKDTEQNIRDQVNSLLNNPSFSKYLQDNIYTQRDNRVVFQVMASNKTKVPGIIHDVSASAKTFYIEPTQLVPLNNKVREVKSKIHAECIRILVELTNSVKEYMPDLVLCEKIMAEIDFHFAKARYAVRLRAVEPELIEEKTVFFENMKHPLLLKLGEDVVANNFEIGKDYKSVIITGSNTGGKTVTLKTIGLFILMARAGMFLPCTYAKVYPFKNVFADIGDSQSILQSLSTFSSHMTNIIEILNQSDDETFVLLDEICAGTDPVEGAVLAQGILEKLAQKQVTSVITTHYGELKALEYTNNYFKNASVEFNTETLKPTYKLLIGIPGLSNAISIASNLGLDRDIVNKVKNILITQKDPTVAVVEKLQETHQQLSKNLEAAQEIKEESLEIKKEYEENLNQVKKDKKKTIKNIKNKFDAEMMEARSEIKQILDELRKEKSEKIARRAYSRLAKLEEGFRGEIDKFSDKQQYLEIDWDKIVVGDIVMLKNMHQKVTIVSLPDKNKRVGVDMGNIKMMVKKDELAVIDDNYKAPTKVQIPGTSYKKFELRRLEMSSTLDLRGYRVEEALDEVEAYLDKASLANLTPVCIIHGHGTGALKQAVREFLSTSPYVAKYRPGEEAEGGDGVCVVDIN
ncbi:MAG: endonuclease MutS2 [Cyanobacteria bacterium SIG26]|nr:endonuclease MutS2 [Cyanobacteria bacterium SIG26]